MVVSKKEHKILKEYEPIPYVVDIWQGINMPPEVANNIIFACATEYSGYEMLNKLTKKCIIRGRNKKYDSIEVVTGGYYESQDLLKKVPTESYKNYAWGNFFLYWVAQGTPLYKSYTKLIDKEDFTHQFTYYPGIPRLQRSQMIDKLAKAKLLNSSVCYSWVGRANSLAEAHEDLDGSGVGENDFEYKFKYFDNKRIVYYELRNTINREHLLTDNHTRLNHSMFPAEKIVCAPFNITMESNPILDFLTEKTYRTLAYGVIPIIISRHNAYTYLESLGFRFPQIVLDHNTTISASKTDITGVTAQKFYERCNKRAMSLIQKIRDNWSDSLLSECIECGRHNQIQAAKIILNGIGIPKSKHIQLYYSFVINRSREGAYNFLKRNNIVCPTIKPIPYVSSFNFNKFNQSLYPT
jgi:hypothetical protein